LGINRFIFFSNLHSDFQAINKRINQLS
jgi:hypothetical protein